MIIAICNGGISSVNHFFGSPDLSPVAFPIDWRSDIHRSRPKFTGGKIAVGRLLDHPDWVAMNRRAASSKKITFAGQP